MERGLVFSAGHVEQQLKHASEALGQQAHALGAELILRCGQLSTRAKRGYDAPIEVAKSIVDRQLGDIAGKARSQMCRAIVAAAGLQLPDTLAKGVLPKSVVELLPSATARLADTLCSPAAENYDEASDLYRKDLRFVVGHTVPCGAQDVDLYSSAPWTTLLKNPWPTKIVRYLAARGAGVWFRIHTDPRNTAEFDEAGWRRCYLRIAALLETHPAIRGMVGTSWFYDPQLIDISPRLAYLQTDPLSGGAFMLRNGPGEIHTLRATLTSPSRRKLYEEGKYLPVCWSVLWPRQALLNWVANGGATCA